jgi:protein-tyrosine phosphatase
VNVRPARREDAESVGAMLDEASSWLAERGYVQWPVPFPRDELIERSERGELWVVELGGEAVGTFTLLWDDPSFWGERPPDAGYLHKLVVRRAHAGRRIGEAVVAWVDAHVAAAGRPFVRLDCMRDDPGIRAYYERLGFEHRGDIDHLRFDAALYERRTRPSRTRRVPGT